MFATRRLAKRSILGTRVCAPGTDGRFYCGKIQATQTWPNGEDVYTIQFGDGYSKTFRDVEIIGPGFQNVSSVSLKRGQRVFVTLNGREVEGQVFRHDLDEDEVIIDVIGDPNDVLQIVRRVEDVRLMESRKSARLQDQGDQDYSRLADPGHLDNSKKRTVSHVIDVPTPAVKQRRRKVSHSPSPEPVFPCNDDEDDKMEDDSSDPPDIMDERTAAMVLTSLSCSPQSPVFPQYLSDKDRVCGSSPTGQALSSVGSSGVWGMKSGPGTPSPPQYPSQNAPSTRVFSTPPDDEGIGLDDTGEYFSGDLAPKKKKVAATRTVFKCIWPACGKLYNTCPAIEAHVRTEHLKVAESLSDSENSDHEEEFYYTEVEVTLDTVTDTFADMRTSSSPHEPKITDGAGSDQEMAVSLPDHDYQKKSVPVLIPSRDQENQSTKDMPFASSFPSVSSTQISKSLSWQSPQTSTGIKSTKSADRLSAFSGNKSHFLSTSPKSSPAHRKTRGDIKKCRKVYGMENKDMWCTQCKWKKACSRFLD